ncbi:hypothetical protein [Cupriavidus sp. IDO]|uniref:hypothetical protein n=1 Tax=Cupriavidus sp. IDO TaxID=1539142 RepID=UPI000578F61F|nr:hypothetical protein [Cupriavidus sp. IDO]KWR88788.1 hypothetical protein RM96_17900 [Cupriavidus sp. IDO]
MGWSLGYDSNWSRDIGYGVPAICDHPDCNKKIDRGLAHICGGEPYGGESGCGLYFCANHLYVAKGPIRCAQCMDGHSPFIAKPDHPDWIVWKLEHASWQQWRDENPAEVERMKSTLAAMSATPLAAETIKEPK